MLQCRGFEHSKATVYGTELCSCKPKYVVERLDGEIVSVVCGRHFQTFKADILKGFECNVFRVGDNTKTPIIVR